MLKLSEMGEKYTEHMIRFKCPYCSNWSLGIVDAGNSLAIVRTSLLQHLIEKHTDKISDVILD